MQQLPTKLFWAGSAVKNTLHCVGSRHWALDLVLCCLCFLNRTPNCCWSNVCTFYATEMQLFTDSLIKKQTKKQTHTCIWKRSEQISWYNSSDYGQVSYPEKMQARSARVLLLAFFFLRSLKRAQSMCVYISKYESQGEIKMTTDLRGSHMISNYKDRG